MALRLGCSNWTSNHPQISVVYEARGQSQWYMLGFMDSQELVSCACGFQDVKQYFQKIKVEQTLLNSYYLHYLQFISRLFFSSCVQHCGPLSNYFKLCQYYIYYISSLWKIYTPAADYKYFIPTFSGRWSNYFMTQLYFQSFENIYTTPLFLCQIISTL